MNFICRTGNAPIRGLVALRLIPAQNKRTLRTSKIPEAKFAVFRACSIKPREERVDVFPSDKAMCDLFVTVCPQNSAAATMARTSGKGQWRLATRGVCADEIRSPDGRVAGAAFLPCSDERSDGRSRARLRFPGLNLLGSSTEFDELTTVRETNDSTSIVFSMSHTLSKVCDELSLLLVLCVSTATTIHLPFPFVG